MVQQRVRSPGSLPFINLAAEGNHARDLVSGQGSTRLLDRCRGFGVVDLCCDFWRLRMNQGQRFDRVSIWLHWLVAGLIVAQFATGWAWGFYERGSVPRMYLFRAHIFMGSSVLALMLFRVVWRLIRPAPPLPDGMGRITALAARATHRLLYLMILLQPVLGLIAITAFGKSLGRWPREVHSMLTWPILAIIILHASAALWHQFIRRDRLLARMLPASLAAFVTTAMVAFPGLAGAEIVATDILGREVRLEQPAQRIAIDDGRYLIALSLIHADPVSLLSAWPRDINRIGPEVYEQYREKFPDIEKLPKIASSAGNFSVEQVLAARPDLAVFSLTSRPSNEQIAQIEAGGVPVAVIDFFDQPLENLEPSLRFLGAVTDSSEQAEDFIAFRDAHAKAISSALAASPGTRPRVFLEPHAARTDECCASPGKGNIGNYIGFAGGENIGAAAISGVTGTLSLEYVIEADPDVYIATGGPQMEGTNGLLIGPGYDAARVQETLRRVADRKGISGLKAVREGHVHGIAHQLINSPLDILTIETLAKWIHPELFADLDPEATLHELNTRFLAVPLEGINWADLK